MQTKLGQKNQSYTMPAGIFDGIELFWHNGQKWLIEDGVKTKFEDAPIKLRDMIVDVFLHDTHSIKCLKKIGITGFEKGFERWWRCVPGALDSIPDFKNGKFTADHYNH